MDFSPPPFLSSSSWCGLWASALAGLGRVSRKDALGVEGRGPRGCAPLSFSAERAPSSPISSLQALLPLRVAALLSGNDFYLELGVVVILSLGHPRLLPVSLSCCCVSGLVQMN